jgi:hypothetical protein
MPISCTVTLAYSCPAPVWGGSQMPSDYDRLAGWHREEAGLCAHGPEFSCSRALLARRWEVRCPPTRNIIIRRRPTGMDMVMARDTAREGEHGMAVRRVTRFKAAIVRRIAVRSAAVGGPGMAARAATQSKAAFVSPIAVIEFPAFPRASYRTGQRNELTGRAALQRPLHLQYRAGILPQTNRGLHCVPGPLEPNAPVMNFFVWNEDGASTALAFHRRAFRGIASHCCGSEVSLPNRSGGSASIC